MTNDQEYNATIAMLTKPCTLHQCQNCKEVFKPTQEKKEYFKGLSEVELTADDEEMAKVKPDPMAGFVMPTESTKEESDWVYDPDFDKAFPRIIVADQDQQEWLDAEKADIKSWIKQTISTEVQAIVRKIKEQYQVDQEYSGQGIIDDLDNISVESKGVDLNPPDTEGRI